MTKIMTYGNNGVPKCTMELPSAALPKNACGDAELTPTSKVLQAGDTDPIYFNMPASPTRFRFRGDGSYAIPGDYNLLEVEQSAMVINNPYTCAELVVHLSGGGRIGWEFDEVDHASVALGGGLDGWSTLIVDGVYKCWLASNAAVKYHSHTFRHLDETTDVVVIPPGGSITIGREVKVANVSNPVLDPSATLYNLADITAICFPKYL